MATSSPSSATPPTTITFDQTIEGGGSISLPLHSSQSFQSVTAASSHAHTTHGAGRPAFPLLAIVFAEFDNTVGPKITCQAPEGFLSDEIFDSISDFIITGPELCHKLVTVSASCYQIIGYPMQLSHKKYHRNALLFNVAFVFPRDCSGGGNHVTHNSATTPSAPLLPSSSTAASLSSTASQLRPYHPVIRKLATILESLELESEFLFRRDGNSRVLQNVINKIFRSLNSYGECSVEVEMIKETIQQTVAAAINSNTQIPPSLKLTPSHSTEVITANDSASSIDSSNKIHLKLYPLLALPPKHIPPYAVPLRIKDLDERWKMEWDLTLRQVIPFMDGVNYVSRISTLSGVHAALVAKCIRQLLYYEAVQLVDIFQFSNIYLPCPRLSLAARLPPDASEGDRIRLEKLRKDARKICRYDTAKHKPPFSVLFRMWASLHGGVCLAEYFKHLHHVLPEMRKQPTTPAPTLESLNIHPRKWIQFGLINGFIKRLHAYPVLVSAYAASSQPNPNTSNTLGVPGSSSQSQGNAIPNAPSYFPSSFLHGDHTLIGVIHGRSQIIDEQLQRQLLQQKSRTGSKAISTRPSRQATDDRSGGGEEFGFGSSGSINYTLPTPPPPNYSSTTSATSFRALERYLDGEHHYDQLCCIFQRTFHQLDEEIKRSRRCMVIYK